MTGLVNKSNGTLDKLEKVWAHYQQAYEAFSNKASYTMSDIPNTWWDSIAKTLNDGADAPYIDAKKVYHLEKSYTSKVHTDITNDFPTDAKAITEKEIFKAWVRQESGGALWGHGYQATPYRVHEGGGDERGSMGFNHILWQRLYGIEDECDDIKGYIGGNDNVNLYHPQNSLTAMFVQAGSANCSHANPLYRAYAATAGGIKTTAKAATKPLSYCYEERSNAQSCAKDATTWTSYSGSDDDYDVLGKALMLYNMGTGSTYNINKAMVDRLRSDIRKVNTNNEMKPVHYGYLMAIKELSWQYKPADGGYLPYRTYIWKGGTIAAKTTTDPVTGVVTNTPAQDWCFVYGEREWSSGVTFDDAKDYSEKYQLGIPKTGTTDYRTTCP